MSTVVLDTITGKSTATTITIGSTPVVSASANSMTIRGEGSAQTSIQQGLAKAWTFCTDNVITDSLNASSSADDATGAYTITLSNNTATANVAGNVSCNENINLIGHRSANSTSTYKIRLKDTNGAGGDGNSGATLHGDLA
jgi:hypothetical protein